MQQQKHDPTTEQLLKQAADTIDELIFWFVPAEGRTARENRILRHADRLRKRLHLKVGDADELN